MRVREPDEQWWLVLVKRRIGCVSSRGCFSRVRSVALMG